MLIMNRDSIVSVFPSPPSYFTLIDLCLFIVVSMSEIYDVKRSSILYPKLVSQRSFDPRTRLPIVMWKYVLPDDQLLILVNGCVTKMS